jgi:hypothetical protein
MTGWRYSLSCQEDIDKLILTKCIRLKDLRSSNFRITRNYVYERFVKKLITIPGDIGLTIKVGLYTGLRQEEIVHLHKSEVCTNLGGCTCDKLLVIKKPNAVTVVIMNVFRGHKKCYFTILPTLIFELPYY